MKSTFFDSRRAVEEIGVAGGDSDTMGAVCGAVVKMVKLDKNPCQILAMTLPCLV